MKTLLTLVLMLTMLTGCASQEAYQVYSDTHRASAEGYYRAAEKPLVDISLPSPDPTTPYHIVLNREVKPMAPEQIKNSEWTGPVNGLISAAGMVGGIWAAGDAMSKITDNAGHNTTTTNTSKDTSISNPGEGSVGYTGDTTTTNTTTSTASTQNSGSMQ